MDNSQSFNIRCATEADVGAVRDLFTTAYGKDYPFTQFYDTSWLTKAVFDDDTQFLVAEDGGEVIGTVSIMFTAGNLSDLIGEFGRLVVHPGFRGGNCGTRLFPNLRPPGYEPDELRPEALFFV